MEFIIREHINDGSCDVANLYTHSKCINSPSSLSLSGTLWHSLRYSSIRTVCNFFDLKHCHMIIICSMHRMMLFVISSYAIHILWAVCLCARAHIAVHYIYYAVKTHTLTAKRTHICTINRQCIDQIDKALLPNQC